MGRTFSDTNGFSHLKILFIFKKNFKVHESFLLLEKALKR